MMTNTCLMGDLVLPSLLPRAGDSVVTADVVWLVTSLAGSPGACGAELQAAEAPTSDVANSPKVVRMRMCDRLHCVRKSDGYLAFRDAQCLSWELSRQTLR